MQKLLVILASGIGSIVVGYIVQKILLKTAAFSGVVSRTDVLHASRLTKFTASFVIQPVAIVASFWTMNPAAVQLLFYPFLGVFAALLGGAVAVVFNRAFAIPPTRAASVFVSGMFANVLTIAGLIGFVFFGEEGYRLAQLFTMFIPITYYMIGYPVSNNIYRARRHIFRLDVQAIRDNPIILVPVGAMIVGVLLNLLHLPRPAFMNPLLAAIVPLISILLGFSIGLSLRLSTVGEYRREIVLIVLIKFLIVPAVIIPVAMLLGLHALADPVPFQMIIVLSVMPVAFNALVPPVVFGFDLDLANAAWLVTTAALIVIVPLLRVVLL